MTSAPLNGSQNFTMYLTVSETSFDIATNSSVVAYSLGINPPGNWEAYSLTSSSNSYSITINGTVISGNFTYDFRAPDNNTNKLIKSGSLTIVHNPDGTKTVLSSASINTANSAVGDGSVSFSITLTKIPKGKRIDSGGAVVPLTTSYRLDSSGAWVPLIIRRRFNGTAWEDVSS